MNTNGAKKIRVLLADDHPIVRAGIRAELERIDRIEVVGEANDGRQAIEMVGKLEPELVFMDISMAGMNGLEATERILKEFPGTKVIILSRHQNEEYYWHALRVGASGYLLKKAAIAELAAAVEQVAGGEIYLSREISTRLRKRLPLERFAMAKNPLDQLSARQREILQLIAEGQNTKTIAQTLNLSPKTIEYHRSQLMERLSIFDIPGLVRFALRSGLILQES